MQKLQLSLTQVFSNAFSFSLSFSKRVRHRVKRESHPIGPQQKHRGKKYFASENRAFRASRGFGALMEIIFNNYSSPKADENSENTKVVKPPAEKQTVTVISHLNRYFWNLSARREVLKLREPILRYVCYFTVVFVMYLSHSK